jgi:hypothetical protein
VSPIADSQASNLDSYNISPRQWIKIELYLKNKLATIKEGVFVGPQIRQLIQHVKFEDQLSEVEKAAWKTLKNVTTNFLGEIVRQKTIVIWWLILYSPIKPQGVICLWRCIS